MEDKEIDDVQTDKEEIHREDEELLKRNIVEKSVVTLEESMASVTVRPKVITNKKPGLAAKSTKSLLNGRSVPPYLLKQYFRYLLAVYWLVCRFVMPETWVQFPMGSNLESAQIILKQ